MKNFPGIDPALFDNSCRLLEARLQRIDPAYNPQVVGVFFRPNGSDILLVESPSQTKWMLPTTFVRDGETAKDAFGRLVTQELGIAADGLTQVRAIRNSWGRNDEVFGDFGPGGRINYYLPFLGRLTNDTIASPTPTSREVKWHDVVTAPAVLMENRNRIEGLAAERILDMAVSLPKQL